MKRIRVLALLAIVILVACVVFSPPPGATRGMAALHNAAHAPIFGFLAVLVLTVLSNSSRGRGMRASHRYLVAFATAVILGIATELMQAMTGRDPSFADATRDVLGAASFLLLIAAFGRHGTSQQRWGVRRIGWTAIAVVLLVSVAAPFKEVIGEYQLRDRKFPLLVDFSQGGSRYFLGDNRTPISIEPMPPQWAARDQETALRVHLSNQRYPGVNIEEPMPRWRDYSTLAMDLTNPTDAPLTLVVRVHDIHHNHRYVDRFNRRLLVEPHTRRVIRIALSDIGRGPKSRKLDLNNIAGVMLFRPEPSGATEMYVSRIWLEGGARARVPLHDLDRPNRLAAFKSSRIRADCSSHDDAGIPATLTARENVGNRRTLTTDVDSLRRNTRRDHEKRQDVAHFLIEVLMLPLRLKSPTVEHHKMCKARSIVFGTDGSIV